MAHPHACLPTVLLTKGVLSEAFLRRECEMNEDNTKGVGPVLDRFGLTSILEAHCFLRFEGQEVDLTLPSMNPGVAS